MAFDTTDETEDAIAMEKKTPDELGSVVIILKKGWTLVTSKQLVGVLRDTANFLETQQTKTEDFDLANFNPTGKVN